MCLYIFLSDYTILCFNFYFILFYCLLEDTFYYLNLVKVVFCEYCFELLSSYEISAQLSQEGKKTTSSNRLTTR